MNDIKKAEPFVIKVYEVVSSPLCVASDDGQKIYDQISDALNKGLHVNLSFFNVKILTSAFLNAAIGQLLGKYKEIEIREKLQISDVSEDDLVLIRRVIETAKEYFKDPERFEQKKREAWGSADE